MLLYSIILFAVVRYPLGVYGRPGSLDLFLFAGREDEVLTPSRKSRVSFCEHYHLCRPCISI